MGRDKALLEIDGEPLWQRQLRTLRQLNPEQLMIAGPPHLSSRAERSAVEGSRSVSWKHGSGNFKEAPRDPSTPSRVRGTPLRMTIADEVENAGPLAGVAAALKKCAAPLLVVLAIDLPRMTAEFLKSLLDSARDGKGVVPRAAEFFEPLAAVYPAGCATLADAALRRGEFSMQLFIASALQENLLEARELRPDERPLFANWNSPADL